MDLINKYFSLSEKQQADFKKLLVLYPEWNAQINLISRKDIANLEERHLLHSLAIAKFQSFKKGSQILDLGCGGGFPGIMLAIFFPDVHFVLVDSRNKKILVVNDVIEQLQLKNAKGLHARAEELKEIQFDFVVTRAVASIDKLQIWTKHLIKAKHINTRPNGIIALKGGNIKEEIKALKKSDYTEITPISSYFEEEFFTEKFVLYLQH